MLRALLPRHRGTRPLRIALVAPPWYPVPPQGYGGTELVIGLLTQALRSAGHDVVLVAAEGSTLATHVAAPAGWNVDLAGPRERLRDATYAARVLRTLAGAGPLDVIHDHSGGAVLAAAPLLDLAPVVHTVHGRLGELERTWYESAAEVALVAISAAQRRSAPSLAWHATIHNPVDVDALTIATRAEKDSYLLCLARICPEKGQHVAIEVARRSGRPLVLAGKIEPGERGQAYYEREIAPAVDGRAVRHITDVAGSVKARLLVRAHALLAPVQWDEPFGLSIAEAMASGTPVVAFPRGAIPELVVPGVTGAVVDDVEAMVDAVAVIGEIDPVGCAAVARARFAPERAGAAYLAAYRGVLAGDAQRSAAAAAGTLTTVG